MAYELVMGLEVHCELSTKSKLFCSCSAKYGAEANDNVCPACAGMPGMLPVTNKRAVELGILAGLVTNSEISRKITFDKKNYFYPDLPAGYQITQWFAPICKNGYIDITTENGERRIRLKQIHIEEDAGKLVHDFRTDTSLCDYNRTSVPLVEVVSKPDFRSAEEVAAYLERLKALFSYAGISDCKMQEGSMRCDVNISVREKGTIELGTRTEIKNMNSIKAIMRAIDYEFARHVDALETGCETLVQETRRWDDVKGMTFSMRSKEDAQDYRYFPNPDLMPVIIGDEWFEKVKNSLPESPDDRCKRLISDSFISVPSAKMITDNIVTANLFDKVAERYTNHRDIANWIVVELFGIMKAEKISIDTLCVDADKFAKIIAYVNKNDISRKAGRQMLSCLVRGENIDIDEYINDNSLAVVSDDSALRKIICEVLDENQDAVASYKNGNKKIIGFLVGKVMKASPEGYDPKTVNTILKEELDK